MALSQNVVVNFLTKFDAKGLKRATKDLKGFDKAVATGVFGLKKLAKAGAVAAVTGLTALTAASIKAALAQEKLDKQLLLTLNSIGQGGLLVSTKEFIDQLQTATNVTEDTLVPALQQLIRQTGDLDAAQLLLVKSLDISAGSGADLESVINAITRAAVGNYTAIGKLGVGFTAAEAKAMGFEKLMLSLDKYTGSAEAATESYAGQLKSFQISAGEATETLGFGFLTASSYIVTGTDNLRTFGQVLQSVAGGVADVVVGFAKSVSERGILKTLNTTFVDLGVEGFKVRQKQYLQAKGYLGLSQQTVDALELQEKFGKKKLTTDQIIAKIQAQNLAREKSITKERKAQDALAKKKAELEALFDLERINLQAALSRKLNAEDELRVKLLQKLKDGTKEAVDEAQRYADVLKVIADGKITTEEVEMLAAKWKMTTPEVLLYLKALFDSNSELQKMLALLDELMKKKLATPPSTGAMFQPGYFTDLGAALVGTPGYSNMTAEQIADERYKESGAARRGIPRFADGGIVTKPTIGLIGEAGAEAVIPLDRGVGATVNVNVAGSVISEGQLQAVIQDVLYNLNRTGAATQLTNLGR